MEEPMSKSKFRFTLERTLDSFEELLSGHKIARIIVDIIVVAVALFLAGFAIYEKMERHKAEKRHVKIEKVTFFEESGIETDAKGDPWLNDLTVKGDRYYRVQREAGGKGQDVMIALGFVVSDFETDDSGTFDVNGEVDLSSGTLEDTGELPPAHDANYMAGRPIIQHLNGKNPEKIKQVFGPLKDKVLYLDLLYGFNSAVLGHGSHTLRIIVRDNRNHTFTEWKETLV